MPARTRSYVSQTGYCVPAGVRWAAVTYSLPPVASMSQESCTVNSTGAQRSSDQSRGTSKTDREDTQLFLFLSLPGQSPLRKVSEDMIEPPTLVLQGRQDQALQDGSDSTDYICLGVNKTGMYDTFSPPGDCPKNMGDESS